MYNKWLDILAGMCVTEPLGFFPALGRGADKMPWLAEALPVARGARRQVPVHRHGCQLCSAGVVVYFTKVFLGRSGDEVNSL